MISFIDRINHCDVEGLGRLMTNDHTLRVLHETPVVGREANIDAWQGYTTSFPSYVIHPRRFSVDGNRVAVLGTTTGSHLGLPDDAEMKLTVIWRADVRDGQLSSWHVIEDTPANRFALGLTEQAGDA